MSRRKITPSAPVIYCLTRNPALAEFIQDAFSQIEDRGRMSSQPTLRTLRDARDIPAAATHIIRGPDMVPATARLPEELTLSPARPDVQRQRLRAWWHGLAGAHLMSERFTWEPRRRRLSMVARERSVVLTEREAAILNFFLQAPDRIHSKQHLLQHIWKYHPQVTTHTLETHIYKLRQKLEENPDQPCIIETLAGGYRLSREQWYQVPAKAKNQSRALDKRSAKRVGSGKR